VRPCECGKLVKGAKDFAICDKHASLLNIGPRPASVDDCAGLLLTLPWLAVLGSY
jgi:hypothetical protein